MALLQPIFCQKLRLSPKSGVIFAKATTCALSTRCLNKFHHVFSINGLTRSRLIGLQNIHRRFLSLHSEDNYPRPKTVEPPWRILFFGTDEFSTNILSSLYENSLAGDPKLVKKLDVVSVQDPKCEVRRFCSKTGLKIYDWRPPLMDGEYDVGVVVSFGHMIPDKLIHMFPYGILNVHPSLLPRWRGASPITHTILSNDSETGVSIMEIRPKHFDIGPILLQEKFAVPRRVTAVELSGFLAREGAKLLLTSLRDLPRLERLEHEQDPDGVSYAHKIDTVMTRVDWHQQSPDEIDRQYRAIGVTMDLRSEWNKRNVRLYDMVDPAEMIDIEASLMKQGKLFFKSGYPMYEKQSETLCIKCKSGWVGFRGIVIKKRMTAKAFYNGYLSKEENYAIPFISHPNLLDKYTFRTRVAHVKEPTLDELTQAQMLARKLVPNLRGWVSSRNGTQSVVSMPPGIVF